MSNEPNKIIKKQLDESFDMLPNGDKLKQGFKESLGKLTDITKPSKEVLGSVGSNHDLDFSMLGSLNQWGSYDDWLLDHTKECKICNDEGNCNEVENSMIESSYTLYTDGEFKVIDGKLEIVNSTIEINVGETFFQIWKSPITTKKGLCSLCYPGQADLNSEGIFLCYALPKEYKYEE